MSFSATSIGIGIGLMLIQLLAALPWMVVITLEPGEWALLRRSWRDHPGIRNRLQSSFLTLGGILLLALVGLFMQGKGSLEVSGYIYGAALQAQLTVDAFILLFVVGLWIWPKGSAVALSAFREGIRQPMFWLLFLLAFLALSASPVIPYFTFGEDHLVVKELGYDTIMLVAALFGTLAASLFIGEEIEGRTAVTVMSKPISRRQFLLGKFMGIMGAALFMYGLLGCYFEGITLVKHWMDRLDPVPPPVWLSNTLTSWNYSADITAFLQGAGMWTANAFEALPGLVLSFCQVMVLIALAVALATRLPMVVNMSTVLVIYFFAHLTPVLVRIGEAAKAENPESTVSQLLAFSSKLFDMILPAFAFFRLNPVLVSNTEVTAMPFLQYVGSVAFYGVLYTSILLLFGLILFEDRDLA